MIRVVVVDDEALVRSGFELILNAASGIRVAATAAGAEAVETVRRERPDVVLLDIRMPDVDGLTVLRELRTLAPSPVVAMLTTFDTDEYVLAALRSGAAGFLLKDTEPEQLAHLVRTLAAGGVVMSPKASHAILHSHPGLAPSPDGPPGSAPGAPPDAATGPASAPAPDAVTGPASDSASGPASGSASGLARGGGRESALSQVSLLTCREREVLVLIAEGLPNGGIGGRLHLSAGTVKDHVSAILAKLGVSSRVQAALLAQQAGLLAASETAQPDRESRAQDRESRP